MSLEILDAEIPESGITILENFINFLLVQK